MNKFLEDDDEEIGQRGELGNGKKTKPELYIIFIILLLLYFSFYFKNMLPLNLYEFPSPMYLVHNDVAINVVSLVVVH